MTSEHERAGALEAVDRIVNRGGADVVGETLAVLARLYGSAELRDDGTLGAPMTTEDDDAFLRRVAVLISSHRG
jgi:hypothetical protein